MKFLATDVEQHIHDAVCTDKEISRSRPIYCGSVRGELPSPLEGRDGTGLGIGEWGVEVRGFCPS